MKMILIGKFYTMCSTKWQRLKPVFVEEWLVFEVVDNVDLTIVAA